MQINRGDLKIVIPDHARRRLFQRGLPLTEQLIAGICALRGRADVGAKEPLALLSPDGGKLVIEFRRGKRRAVVATVLDREQRLQAGTRSFPLTALLGGDA